MAACSRGSGGQSMLRVWDRARALVGWEKGTCIDLQTERTHKLLSHLAPLRQHLLKLCARLLVERHPARRLGAPSCPGCLVLRHGDGSGLTTWYSRTSFSTDQRTVFLLFCLSSPDSVVPGLVSVVAVAVAGVVASSSCGVVVSLVVPIVVVAVVVEDSRRAASAELDASFGGPVVVVC
jgi:hypothetical protein